MGSFLSSKGRRLVLRGAAAVRNLLETGLTWVGGLFVAYLREGESLRTS